MKRPSKVLVTLLIFLNLIQPSYADSTTLSTVSPNTDIAVALSGTDYSVASSSGTSSDLFFSIDERYLDFGTNTLSTDKFTVEVTSKDSTTYYLRITPKRPLAQGCWDLFISQSSTGQDAIQRAVCIPSAYSQNLFKLNRFNFSCDSYNRTCSIIPDFTGDYPAEWSSESITVVWQDRDRGTKKWWGYDPTQFYLDQNIVFVNEQGVSTPKDVRALVTYRGKTYTTPQASVLGVATLTIRAPGAAIVGSNFNVFVSGPKNYSASCILDSSVKFSIKNGVGKLTIHGTAPGRTLLNVACSENANWIATWTPGEIYIRE